MYRLEKTFTTPEINPGEPIYFDIETVGLYGFPRLLQFYQEGWDEVLIYDSYFVNWKEVWRYFQPHWLIGFNLSYDFGTLKETSEEFDDLYFLAKLAFPELQRFSLDAVLERIGVSMSTEDKKAMQKANWARAITPRMLTYAAEDVKLLPKLWEAVRDHAKSFPYRLDKQTLRYTIDLQQKGMPVSEKRHHALRAELVDKLAKLEAVIPVNYNSSPQVKEWLGTDKADVNAIRQMINRTDEEALLAALSDGDLLKRAVHEGSERAAMIYHARKMSKQLNFLEKYDKPRVYGHFNPCGARSGRFSCSEENIQQIPKALKNVFGFDEGDNKTLVAVDFPQIELRIAVAMWGEPEMERLFKTGEDLHISTAAFIYGIPESEVSETQRQVAKSANFGLLYGMGARKFRNYVHTNTGIDMTEEEAKIVRAKWFEKYIGFAIKHREVGQKMRYHPEGVYEGRTLFGRPYVGETLSDALNIMIQGTGAELMKLALHYLLKEHDVKVVNVIHDAIVAESKEEEAEVVGQAILGAMERAWAECCRFFPEVKDLPCPLDVDISKVYGG